MGAYTKEEFIENARSIHENKYDYSKVDYKNNYTKVCIICPKHGEFWQLPKCHLKGQGCPKCNGKIKKSTEEFIEEARKVHGDKYDYSKVNYVTNHTKACIICPEHGEFWQSPLNHLHNHGCPMCSKTSKSNTEDFINKSLEINGNKYDYSKTNYVTSHTKVCITCEKHGDFWIFPFDHLRNQGCPKCGHLMSTAECEIVGLLKDLPTAQRNREILNGKEIDIYIPSLKLGIEYNGLRWHSEEFGKDKHYHLNKLEECNKQGVCLIQIFEDEWINHREICESKIKQICGLNNNPKVYARKCFTFEITNREAREFLERNHIQGFASATVYLGCFYNNKLVGVMTFKREKEGYWDLNRFATDINYQCIGIGGKLFKYFTRNYDSVEIKSFADRRWTVNTNDNLYTKLGFEFSSFLKPDYKYFINNQILRLHKFNFRKQILHKKYGFPLTMTEDEMTKNLGYMKIWDCGLIKYIYRT